MSRSLLQKLISLVAVSASAYGQAAPSVHQVANRVDEHYNHLASMQADFDETYQGAGVERTERGVLWLKRQGKMRWEYLEPRHKIFISDGKRTFFYVFGESQAQEVDLKSSDDIRSPLRYLLGKTKLEKEFDGLRLAATAGESVNVILIGRPRALADRVEEVQLEVNAASEIVRIVILQLDGSRTEFRFHGIQENVPAADNLFRFSVPSGVQVVRREDVGP